MTLLFVFLTPILGEMSQLLVDGQRVVPTRAPTAPPADSFKRAASSAAPSRRLRRHGRHPLIGPSCGRGPTTCEGIGTIFAGVASSAQSNPSSVPFGLQIRS
jgi:hypothetical protein